MLLISIIACDVFAHDIVVMFCCAVVRVVRVMSMCACDRRCDAWTHPHDGHTCFLPSCMLHVASHLVYCLTHAAYSLTCVAVSHHTCCMCPSCMLHFFPSARCILSLTHSTFSLSCMLHFLPHAHCILSFTHVCRSATSTSSLKAARTAETQRVKLGE